MRNVRNVDIGSTPLPFPAMWSFIVLSSSEATGITVLTAINPLTFTQVQEAELAVLISSGFRLSGGQTPDSVALTGVSDLEVTITWQPGDLVSGDSMSTGSWEQAGRGLNGEWLNPICIALWDT